MGFTSFRMGHTHKPKSRKLTPRAATPNPSCATGGFYKAPANGATIDSLKPLNIEWDVTCLDTQKVDIHLLAPWFNGDNTEITVWPNIPFADAKHTVNIKPKWWNSTSSVNVQLTIVPAGTPPGLTTLPAGPVITATYTPPADGSIPASADLTKPDSPGSSSSSDDDPISGAGTTKSLSGGKTAAAVLLPLLFVALAIFAYLRYQRRKATAKSKRFSEAIDKRMSTISTDWKSMSAAGAQAAIRNSIAVNRDSSAFAFGAIRPLSTASVGGGGGPGDMQVQQMTQVRTGTGVGLRNPGTAAAIAAERASRVSRVSFADTARPSGESSRRTRAFHSAYVPPLPTTRTDVMSTASVYPDSELEKEDKDKEREEEKMRSPTLSPRQATGPLTLTPEDIRSRIQGRNVSNETKKERDQSAEYDEVMPALSMMRTGLEPTTPSATTTSFTVPTSPLPAYTQTADEYLFTPLPTPPAPTYASSSSTISSPYTQSFASPTYTTPALLSPINTSNSPFTPSAYAYNPAQPSTPISPNPNPNPNPAPATMSPDDMLRAYAERQALASASSSASPSSPGPRPPPPSAFSHGGNTGSPKVKGRKLSLRASFGIKGLKGSGSGGGGLERTQSQMRSQSPAGGLDKAVIGYPMPAAAAAAVPGTPRTPVGGMGMGMGAGGAGMAGVGARGMAGVGAAGGNYAIGEDEDDVGGVDYESAYVM